MLRVFRSAQQRGMATSVSGLTVGSPAPKFSCVDHTGATVSLGDYANKKLCIWFYPRASTGG